MVSHVVIISENLEFEMAPCPVLCFKVAEARTTVLLNYLNPMAHLSAQIITQKRCVTWYLLLLSFDVHLHEPQPPLPFSQSSCPPTTPVSLGSQGNFAPHFTQKI